MTLIKCPECRKKISDQCGKCPHCGYPLSELASQNTEEVEKNVDTEKTEVVLEEKKSINKKLLMGIMIGIVTILIVGGIICYNALLPKINATKDFNKVVKNLEILNKELEQTIKKSEDLIMENPPLLDEGLLANLENAVSDAKAAKITNFTVPDSVDAIKARITELNSVDYTVVLNKLTERHNAILINAQRYQLVNQPTEAYVIQCLRTISEIVNISAVTEDNDPNGQLNKPGGYTVTVYFSDGRISLDKSIYGETLIEQGTDAGGAIEVYTCVEDAIRRRDYLAVYDGGVFANGTHTVIGTVLVRTSNELTASQQKELETKIIAALTYLPEYDKTDSEQIDSENNQINTEENTTTEIPSQSDAETTTTEPNKEETTISSKSKAVNRAIELYNNDYLASRSWIKDWLMSCDAFSENDAQYAIDNCNVDWKKTALAWVNEYSDDSYIYPALVEDDLASRWYTEDEIKYALNNCSINWNECAVLYAGDISDVYTKSDIIESLQVTYGFTKEQASYGIEHSNIDWFTMAEKYTDKLIEDNQVYFVYCRENNKTYEGWHDRCPSCHSDYLEIGGFCSFTKEECITKVTNAGFSYEEAEYAVSRWDEYHSLFAGGNNYRNTFAYYSFDRYFVYAGNGFSREDMTAVMKEWGFSDSEIAYAQSFYEDYHFSN